MTPAALKAEELQFTMADHWHGARAVPRKTLLSFRRTRDIYVRFNMPVCVRNALFAEVSQTRLIVNANILRVFENRRCFNYGFEFLVASKISFNILG